MISSGLKSFVKSSLYHSGCFDALRALQRSRITILMYHRFSSTQEPFKLSQITFEKQLKFLSGRYNFINFEDYLLAQDGECQPLPSNSLLLTIDDGFADNYNYAYPVLKKYGLPATIFLSTDFISHKAWLWSNRLEYILKNSMRAKFSCLLGDQEESFQIDSFVGWHKAQLGIFNYCRALEYSDKDKYLEQLALDLGVRVPAEVTADFQPLTWGQLKEMHNNGITYGSHGCSHSICSRLSSEELIAELIESKREIEKNIVAQVKVFCYPNGQPEDFSDNIARQVEKSGYQAAVTTVAGFNILGRTDPFILKRLSVACDDNVSLFRALTRRDRTV